MAPHRGDALHELRSLTNDGVAATATALSDCFALREYMARKLDVPVDAVDGQAARRILAWVIDRARNRNPPESSRKTPSQWDAPLIIGALIDPFSEVPPAYEVRLEAARVSVDKSRRWTDHTRYRALKESLKENRNRPQADFVLEFLNYLDNQLSDPSVLTPGLLDAVGTRERLEDPSGDDGQSSTTSVALPQSADDRTAPLWEKTPDPLPTASSLVRRSQQFAADLAHLLRANDGTILYVRRDIEDVVVAKLLDTDTTAAIVVKGAPGHGKSTLLWSIYSQFQQVDRKTPVLVSANWLAGSGAEVGTLAMSELVTALRSLHNPMLLLDTADLLLHDDNMTTALCDVLELLTDERVPWVLTSRLEEAAFLRRGVGTDVLLSAYNDQELGDAVHQLTQRFCPRAARPGAIDEIRDAVARALPAASICQSPLLLRILFELAVPEFPVFRELDVTGLFLRYWKQRVVEDLRAGLAWPAGSEALFDLSYRTAGFGLALVAEGRPSVSRDVLIGVAEDIAAHWQGTDTADTDKAADILVRRGVLVYQHDYIGFFHQIMFEFAAAQAMIARGGDAEIRTMARRLDSDPGDLFVGAVYEQFLVLLGRRESARAAVAAATRALLQSDHSTLRGIGLAVWAHHPDLVADHADLCRLLPAEELRRFADIAPTVAHPDNRALLAVLESFWQHGDRSTRILVAEVLEQLARRAPADVAPVVQRLDCVQYLVQEHFQGVRAQPTVTDLIAHLASADPSFARSAILLLATEFRQRDGGRDALNPLLSVVARREVWRHIGNEEFLESLKAWFMPTVPDPEQEQAPAQERAARRSQRVTRAVRDRLGAVYAEYWMHSLDDLLAPDEFRERWMEFVEAICEGLEADGEDPVAGSMAIGAAPILLAQTDTRLVKLTLDRLFSIESQSAQRELGKGLFPRLLASESIARSALAQRFTTELNQLKSKRTWPAVVRDCLLRDDVPLEVIAPILTASSVVDAANIWFELDGLLKIAPRAAVAGVEEASDFLDEIANNPNLLEPGLQGKLLETCSRAANVDPSLARVMVTLAVAKRHTAQIEQLAENPNALKELRRLRVALNLLIDQVMQGTARDRASAARLWQSLVRCGALEPDLARVVKTYKATTFPEAKAALLTLAATSARADPSQCQAAIGLFGTVLMLNPGPPPTIGPTAAGENEQPQVLEAARQGWLDTLAAQPKPNPAPWPIIRALVFRGSFRASKEDKDSIAGIANVSQYITNLTGSGYAGEALGILTESIIALSAGLYSSKQQTNAANRWIRAIDKVVESGYPSQVRQLIARIPELPETFSQLVITAIFRRDYLQFASDLDGLLRGPLPDRTARHLRKHLQTQARQIGSKPFPEIAFPAGHFGD